MVQKKLNLRFYKYFSTVELILIMYFRNESTALPRIELQLRFFLLDYSAEQHDDFPPNCNVKIDDVPVTLPVNMKFVYTIGF